MQKKETRGQPTALTSGNIRKQLVLFAIPIFLGTLLQQLYNVIDAVVAGRLVNEDALSAIGVSVPIYLLVFWGIPFSMLYNLLGAVMRSFGETKMPLYALGFSSIINLVLNIVFVINGGGVIGIAASTIIAQAISGVYLLVQLRKKFPMVIPMRSEIVFDKKLLEISLKICTPIIIQQLAVFLGMLIVQGFINQLGNAGIGGMTAASRIEAFILLPVQALGNALIYGLGGVLSGVGNTLIAGIHSLASILVKLFITVLLIGKLGLLSIAIASCLGWCVASAIVVMRYKENKWQSKAVVKMIQN
ncbi:MAG: hypothetical protein HFG56_13080 [Lachnospiraceae bacterium]|nr:hypothetical protein [Lachnospiraceae bacterium]